MAENQDNRERDEPEVIAPGRTENTGIAPLAIGIQNMINSMMCSMGMSMAAVPRDIDYEDLDESSKKIVDAFMDQLRPEIEEKAKALLTAEIRERIVRKADLIELKKALKKGKKLSLKRKKGCIFAQFGTGEPDDEITELLLASS